jgi:hypothetical protein
MREIFNGCLADNSTDFWRACAELSILLVELAGILGTVRMSVSGSTGWST